MGARQVISWVTEHVKTALLLLVLLVLSPFIHDDENPPIDLDYVDLDPGEYE